MRTNRTSFASSRLLTPKLPPPTSLAFRVPAYGTSQRWLVLASGGAALLWTSLEDNHVLPVVLLGAALALALMLRWITRRWGGSIFAGRAALLGAAGAGALTGVSAALATTALMLLKDGLHAHLFPDYPFGMIIDILARAPLWALAGALAAVGLLLAWWALHTRDQSRRARRTHP